MLRTTIQTTDEAGKELPVPPDLLAKVRRAAELLEGILRRAGKVFEIESRWRFERAPGGALVARLDLTSGNRGATGYEFSPNELASDETITRGLWEPIRLLTPILSEEVDRDFERIRLRREHELVTTAEG
jgi:hypothetical protein